MKTRILFIAAAFLMAFNLQAQAPEKFNYQGIARNASGQALANQALGLRISILNPASTPIYVETHTTTTNDFGLYNIAIGSGSPVSGTMAGVNWAGGNKSIKVEIDPNGGTSYTSLGTTELLSVPYALYAASAPGGGGSNPTGPAGGDLSGSYPNPTIANNAVTAAKIANGTVNTADLANNAVTTGKIANGTIATADLANDAVTAGKIDDMGAASGQVLEWNGTNWAPATDDSGSGGSALWTQSGTEVYYNGGNVGIGTTNPASEFEVVGNAGEVARFKSGTGNMWITFYEGSNKVGYVGTYSGGTNDFDIGTDTGSTGKFHLATDATPRLTIDNNGDVGIGTTTPSNRLEITGPNLGPQFVSIEPTSLLLSDDILQMVAPSSASNYQFIEANDGTSNVFILESDGNIMTAGKVSIGNTTNPTTELHVEYADFSSTSSGGTHGLTIKNTQNTSPTSINFQVGTSTNNLYIYDAANNNIATINGTTGAYSAVSDARFKIDFQPMGVILPKLMQLNALSYKFKNQHNEKRHLGFIAQEVEKLFPSIVNNPTNEDGSGGNYTMNYSAFGVIAVRAVQEQQKTIESLKEIIKTMQAQIKALQQK